MAKLTEIRVPDIGDFKNIEIIEIAVKPGDSIEVEQTLISLESDKATMEIPSSAAGIVRELKVKVGDRVSQGDLIALVEAAGNASAGKPAPAEPARAAEAAAPAAATEQEITVPDIGDFKSVEVIDILVKAGDEVEVETPLISLESDKATMDIPSPQAGRIVKLLVKKGDKVAQGNPIAIISAATPVASKPAPAASTPAPAAAKTPAPAAPVASTPVAVTPASVTSGKVHASPAIRMFARELGVDLGRVSGSGRKGRILRDDVTAFTRSVMSGQGAAGGSVPGGLFGIPAVDFSKFGATEIVPMSRLNKLSSQNLHRSWVNIPHVTQFDEADITALEAYRVSKKRDADKAGTKLTILSFLIKAAVVLLKKYPRFNSSLAPNGEELYYKKYYHIGFAVNTDAGLMVPVIKNADQKGLLDIAKELAELAQKARDKRLPPADMQGACFTISSLGHISGTGFTPIINPPEVAIMGVSRSSMKPVYIDGKFEPRMILPFSLSYDHRVIDGVAAAEFTRDYAQVLVDLRDMIL